LGVVFTDERFDLAQRLFDLPEYGWAMAAFVEHAVRALRDRKNPLLAKIPVTYVEHVQVTRVTMPSGEVVESQPADNASPFFIDLKSAISGNPDSLLTSIDEAAEHRAAAEWEFLLSYSSRVTDAAGTSFNTQGRPMDCGAVLGALESLEVEFDEDGHPILPAEVRHLFHRPSQACTCFTDGRSDHFVVVMRDPTRDMREVFSRIPPAYRG
jgi:hypothetical protein